MRVAVAGGTGVVGRHVVDALVASGHEAVVLSRSHGVDVATGRGLEPALVGTQAVVDVSNVTTAWRSTAVAFFTSATTRLLEAGRQAGVGHHVALSIVGVDRVDYGYYAGKLAQEALVLDGPVPGSVLRTTQLHEFAGQLIERSPGPVPIVPHLRTQPVAASEVADALVALATGPAVGLDAELAGPQEHDLVDLARRLLRARGRRALLVPVPVPGRVGRQMAAGGLLPTGSGPRGRLSFDAWLAAQRES